MDPVGGALAVGAYLAWGLVAIYWKALGPLPAWLVLSHRILFSALALGVVVTAVDGWRDVGRAIGRASTRRALLASTALITVNWGLFLWAVISGRMVEASLGYFLNPLVNVALGTVFLRERLRPGQWGAVGLAALGVAALTWTTGRAPWLALALAVTFGAYGLVRKRADVGAVTGLFVETALVLPAALGAIAWSEAGHGGLLRSRDAGFVALLAASGVITAGPLLAFNAAARRLPLSTLGFFQYLSPTCQLLLAVFAYGEPLGRERAWAFAAIWISLAVFVGEAWRHSLSLSSSSSSSSPESSVSSSSSSSSGT
ncbi:MAG: EamA family transporter RarD [Polyangiaceae bacterium]|nr:EamA family transporter RarD [Polyangiaceae bacterium]